jgi:hypothetical protein
MMQTNGVCNSMCRTLPPGSLWVRISLGAQMNYWVVLDAPKPWAVGAVFSSGTHISLGSYSWFGIYVLLTLVAAGCWLSLGLGISFCKYNAALPLFPSGRILSFWFTGARIGGGRIYWSASRRGTWYTTRLECIGGTSSAARSLQFHQRDRREDGGMSLFVKLIHPI